MIRPLLLTCLAALAARAELPAPSFYLPFDGSTVAAVSTGSPREQMTVEDPLLALVPSTRFEPGKVGQAFDVPDSPLVYRSAGNFNAAEGTCAFWLSPHYRGDSRTTYAAFFGAGDWGMVYKYVDQTGITFATAKPGGDLYYDCGGGDFSAWRPDEWHHVALTWSAAGNRRQLFVDGKRVAQAPFAYHVEVKDAALNVGAGTTKYGGNTAHGRLDEFALWDRPLDDAQLAEVFGAGQAGRALFAASAARAAADATATLNLVSPTLPAAPAATGEPSAPAVPGRTWLDGWWAFLPAAEPLAQLPAAGWGLAKVPGYRNQTGMTVDPAGRPTTRDWPGGLSLATAGVGYYQTTFGGLTASPEQPLFLHLDGVEGLAEVYLNGRRLGRLPGWQAEAYDLGPALRADGPNTLTIALHRRGGQSLAGIYDHAYLQRYGRAFVKDVVVRPQVAARKVTFSCDVWHGGPATDAQLELAVRPAADFNARPKTFIAPCHLEPANRQSAELSSQMQRVEATFDWPDAHPWTYDDPFLYTVAADIRIGGKPQGGTGPQRFGYRQFEQRGADFYLNGVPTHLRGHQIDLGWGKQFERLQELKGAGLNCFEFSGPISDDWYRALPYQGDLYEAMLTYADEHGLLALPILPDATVLRDRVLDPEIARLYRHRLDNFTRRYGNHASVAMWYMHFNLAGYWWYVAPSKQDGSYTPTDPQWLRKERYGVAAQRIAQSVDPRPLYHHACGNFGDQLTGNVYIGPNSPLQEREEWPRAWAAKRPKPLMAVEHGLMLIPYWFRLRKFPLNEVYASEPIFDEISAMYQGEEAYRQLTPAWFDAYDVGGTKRGATIQPLLSHPGYQAVKSLFARRSLRSWRTYGTSAIIFNAENWDWFKDGQPLPVHAATARYFGDVDLYVGGPAGDWESKDHAFWAGETVRKQAVLINDLTRDVPCPLTWKVVDAQGNACASGRLEVVAQAGQVTFAPFEFAAPAVKERTELTLRLQPAQGPFLADTFPVQVFPKAAPTKVSRRVLVYDPVGKTTAMLQRAGIASEPLRAGADLRNALVIVGREAYDDAFVALAKQLDLDAAVRAGTSLLAMEQTKGRPFGLELKEASTRNVFATANPLIRTEDLTDWRGASDLEPAYPDTPPRSDHIWPPRFFKWGNRGVVATYVYTKPHRSEFCPMLESGFDLAESPLLVARHGSGLVVLCQVDVTSRYGLDPAATSLFNRLLIGLQTTLPSRSCAAVGESARQFLASYGVRADADPAKAELVVIGREPAPGVLEAATARGAKVLLLPGAAGGPKTHDERLFRVQSHGGDDVAFVSDADLYFKEWVTLPVMTDEGNEGWVAPTQPCLVAVRKDGDVVSCTLDLAKLGPRAKVKATRFWSILLDNLGAPRAGTLFEPAVKPYEDAPWEVIPPYMDW